MMWIGLALFAIGSGVALSAAFLNSLTPAQVGPVPVIGGGVVALVGLILFLSHI